MKKKNEKLLTLSPEHREALANLASNKDFKALERLFKIEESNIIIQTFKINSADIDLPRRKAWMEGRIWELRKVMKTFQEVMKGREEE
jgi:hypothetical protein